MKSLRNILSPVLVATSIAMSIVGTKYFGIHLFPQSFKEVLFDGLCLVVGIAGILIPGPRNGK